MAVNTELLDEAVTKINHLASESLGRIFGTKDDEALRIILIDFAEKDMDLFLKGLTRE